MIKKNKAHINIRVKKCKNYIRGKILKAARGKNQIVFKEVAIGFSRTGVEVRRYVECADTTIANVSMPSRNTFQEWKHNKGIFR